MKLSSCWSCWEPEKTKGGGTIQYVSSICLEMTSISWLKLRVFPILLGARLERDMCVKTKPNCLVSPLWDLTMSPSHWGIRAYRFVSPLRPCRTHTHTNTNPWLCWKQGRIPTRKWPPQSLDVIDGVFF